MPQLEQQYNHSSENRLIDGLTALGIFIIIVMASLWVGEELSNGKPTVWLVLVAATITAVATGFGALPFLFVRNINKQWLGMGNALAAGLMLGASISLVFEGATIANIEGAVLRVIVGMVIGVVLVYLANKRLTNQDEKFSIGRVQGADALQMLIIVGIMTVHSFAEGIGVGVSFGGDDTFGVLITSAIAIHNIPEGLAISLILIPRGVSVSRAALWSIFSSLPQPIMAVPAFLFVLAFHPLLPIGLGLAAGAMIWMVFAELLPEALEEMPAKTVYPIAFVSVIAMLAFQFLMGG